MNIPTQIAQHFREVHFGGNWTWANLKEQLSDLTWQQATTQVYSFNTIAALTFHMNYFVEVALKVLEGKPLVGRDKDSFNLPPITCEEDWQKLLDKTFTDAENFAKLLEQLPESKLLETFVHEKYGNYYRNMHGIIEHLHYHLGQIAIIKKIILEQKGESKR